MVRDGESGLSGKKMLIPTTNRPVSSTDMRVKLSVNNVKSALESP